MTERQCKAVATELRKLFPDSWIRREGRALGAWTRMRSLSIVPLFWTLTLGFCGPKRRTLAGLRRLLAVRTGISLSYSSFYERFNLGLARLLRSGVLLACQSLERTSQTARRLAKGIEDVLCIDSTVLRLRSKLRGEFKGTDTQNNGAAAKLHAVLSVARSSPKRVMLSAQSQSDLTPFRRLGSWVRSRLLLFDLGYYCYNLFVRIDERGGYFLTRVKATANPLIVGSFVRHRGRCIDLRGQQLQDVLGRVRRGFLDLEVELDFHRRAWRGWARPDRARFRLVGVLNHQTRSYHLYLTNLESDEFSAEECAELYRLRWQVELLFLELKTHTRLDQLNSERTEVVQALLWASMLALLLSRSLLRAAQKRLRAGERIGLQSWAALFETLCPMLLEQLIGLQRSSAKNQDPFALLARLTLDPHRKRESVAREVYSRIG